MGTRWDDARGESVGTADLLGGTYDLAVGYLHDLPARRVVPHISAEELRSALGGPMPEEGTDPVDTIRSLSSAVEPGLVASSGPRYFGFVIGGSLPVAIAADWLTSTWDQNAGLHVAAPAASVVEQVAATWLLDIFGLPATASVGFVTGCQMANFTALAAARNAVLSRLGWDVEQGGLREAPPVDVIVGAEAHVTILSSLRMLGFGSRNVRVVETDGQGRMKAEGLGRVLDGIRGASIVCAQAGNVNTGSFDPLSQIAKLCKKHRAWLHVDGAFGLWAAASPSRRERLSGVELADSWATDAHKWLNVPYDSGIAIVADPVSHRRSMSARASYLERAPGVEVDPLDWVPESSRRARGFALYAALRSLGRKGITEMVERCCHHARHMARLLEGEPGFEILNDVVLNQVLVRVPSPDGTGSDELTQAVIARVQREGTCWLGGTTWHGMAAMRISISNWSTTEDDIGRSAAAIIQAKRAELG